MKERDNGGDWCAPSWEATPWAKVKRHITAGNGHLIWLWLSRGNSPQVTLQFRFRNYTKFAQNYNDHHKLINSWQAGPEIIPTNQKYVSVWGPLPNGLVFMAKNKVGVILNH